MFRFTRTAGVVTALALTLSTFSATSASAMYRGMGHGGGMMHHGGGMYGMRHGGMGGYGRAMAIGAGVGVGLMLLNAAVQAQQNQPQIVREVDAPPPPVKRKPVVRNDDKPRHVRKDDNKPKIVIDNDTIEATPIRYEHPVLIAPVLPDVKKAECGNIDCDRLFQSIEYYKKIIGEDTTKLQIRETDAKNRTRQADQYDADAKNARNDIDRKYFKQMAAIERASAKQLEADNASFAKLIEQEKDILADRIRQYERCLAQNCPPAAGPQAANKQ